MCETSKRDAAAALRCSRTGPPATSATHLGIPRHIGRIVKRERLVNRFRTKTKEEG